ncbi:MAG: hypothetical protein JWR19_2557 [Pedosphaera sp.]|nr:hypothetical protein [Pedosphaera sp.]
MKKQLLLSLISAVGLVTAARAGEVKIVPPLEPSAEPVPIFQAPALAPTPTPTPPTVAHEVYVYDQRPLQQQPALIAPDQAQAIVDQFRTNYPKLESPRVLIYVNRELVDEQSGIKLSGRSERVETITQSNPSTGTNAAGNHESTWAKSVVKNNYHNEAKAKPTLADRQTVRDVERLFGRPLRLAGVSLVDQRLATQMIGDQPLKDLAAGTEGQQASKDREAISKIADVVVEILISSRQVTVSEVSGDKNYTVPDIQATAIRLKDAKIIGQVTASDAISRAHDAGFVARNFGVQDITEATALGLMEDILRGAQ